MSRALGVQSLKVYAMVFQQERQFVVEHHDNPRVLLDTSMQDPRKVYSR